MSSHPAAFYSAPRVVYVIEGAGVVYVGCTFDAAKRRNAHWLAGANGLRRPLPIHVEMRRAGVDAFTFTVVACARNRTDGEATEYAVIRQLRAEGANVLNVHPRDDMSPLQRAPESVGALLGRLRGELGYSQSAFARAIGVGVPTLWKWEAGRALPSTYALIALWPVLGERTALLFTAVCAASKQRRSGAAVLQGQHSAHDHAHDTRAAQELNERPLLAAQHEVSL